MHRCLQLAAKGAGFVAPNPLVGAVLVYEGRIIGEGWHRQYGQAHAEVNCLQSVLSEDKELISQSVLYVSLEPCSHTGKTPPCTRLILEQQIKEVVVGCVDPFLQVNGTGIERLLQAGVQVTAGVLEAECRHLNRRFFTVHQQQRPYIILKWAQTANGIMGTGTGERLLISNELTNRLVHQWRGEEAAVMVGRNTAGLDNPQLNNRYASGGQPIRVVADTQLQLPAHLHLFDGTQKTIVLNAVKEDAAGNVVYHKIEGNEDLLQQQITALHRPQIQSVLVEGGAALLRSFIDAGCWDEVRIITNTNLYADKGIAAPRFNSGRLANTENILTDRVDYYFNPQ
jgi:diaminohydroxyphosphoribosylaminopyrimidine deaminase / 5-amino-6-(5-phosphoribosylamino)uracil reductase